MHLTSNANPTNVLSPQRLKRKFRTYLTVKERADSRGRVYGSINVEAKRMGRRLAMQVNNPLLSVQASKSAADREGILNQCPPTKV